jgi:CheY-like chemotaxis protein
MEQGRIVRKRILLADDQPEVRSTIKLLLRLDEHSVAEAGNGREALDLFRPNLFDLVITDYAMPEMRGDELAENLKRLAPSQPILMLTGSVEALGGAKNPVDALLRKPFSLGELRRVIAQLC